jgi:phosphoribosylamine--glycine ligase
MIKDGIPKVVEFNVRLGDPETQVVMPLIRSDVFDLFNGCAKGNIADYRLQLKESSAVVVVLASKGYPDLYQTGKEISGLETVTDDTIVFHAGTKNENGKIISTGGRVLGVTSLGTDLTDAIRNVYAKIPRIQFENNYYRTDIGKKGLNRAQ